MTSFGLTRTTPCQNFATVLLPLPHYFLASAAVAHKADSERISLERSPSCFSEAVVFATLWLETVGHLEGTKNNLESFY